MPKRDRRSEIMAAAEKLFTTRRFHEITLDDIVHQARVGKGTVYRYFQDKDDVFFQTATRGFDEMCDLLTRRVPNRADFGRQLLAACRHIGAFFRQRRELFRMMQSEEARMHWCDPEIRHRWMQRRRKLVASLAGILRKGVREGRLRADIRPEVLAAFLLGMLRTRARDLSEDPEFARSFEGVVSLFCEGAGRAGEAPAAPSLHKRQPGRRKRRT